MRGRSPRGCRCRCRQPPGTPDPSSDAPAQRGSVPLRACISRRCPAGCRGSARRLPRRPRPTASPGAGVTIWSTCCRASARGRCALQAGLDQLDRRTPPGSRTAPSPDSMRARLSRSRIRQCRRSALPGDLLEKLSRCCGVLDGAVEQRLDAHLDDRQGRLQFVRDVGDEVLAQAFQPAQLGGVVQHQDGAAALMVRRHAGKAGGVDGEAARPSAPGRRSS